MDQRFLSFLTVCRTMNYRKAAELLYITQPAISQHIHSLEKEYGVKLFLYDGKKLTKTREGEILRRYAISMNYNYGAIKEKLKGKEGLHLRIGATKTIGEFVIGEMAGNFLSHQENSLSVTVDNTACLLERLDENELDFAIIEGPFDKRNYGWKLFRCVPFVGICSAGHPFAGKLVSLSEILKETLFVREAGSGTRTIFEQQLAKLGYGLSDFSRVNYISSFSLLKQLVAMGLGITFAYQSILTAGDGLESFSISTELAEYDYNLVFLKGTPAKELAERFGELQFAGACEL